jgi:hypothetical protein
VPETLTGVWIGHEIRLEIFADGTYITQFQQEKLTYRREEDRLTFPGMGEARDVQGRIEDSPYARKLVIPGVDTLYQIDPVSWSASDLTGVWRYDAPPVEGGDVEWFAGRRGEDGSYIYQFYYLNPENETYSTSYDRGTWGVTPAGLVKEVARMQVEEDSGLYTVNIQMIRKGKDWNSWLLMSSDRPGLVEEGMPLLVDRRAGAEDLFVEIPFTYSHLPPGME